MKNGISLLVVAVLLCSIPAYAQAPGYIEGAFEKAKHGITNTITGWLELPIQIGKGWENGVGEDGDNKLLGALGGILRGLQHGLGRTLQGMVQLATFPLPNPATNEGVGVPLDAEFAFEQGEQYSILQDGIEPIGEKAFRGATNLLLGVLDGPAQLTKGFRTERPFLGMLKSLVYPVTRIVYGVYELGTAALPNDTETYGYPLEETYPWSAFYEENYENEL